jgi:hypothetical protein
VYAHLMNEDVSEAEGLFDPLRRVEGIREVDGAKADAAAASRNGSRVANLSGTRT